MAKHSVDQWNMDEDVQLSNVRGYSMLQKLPKTLKEAYPNLRPFKFAFFIYEDLPDRYADQWVHLTTDDFPDEDRIALNTAISSKGGWTEEATEKKKIGDLREKVRMQFNIEADAEGRIKYKLNFIMIQPLDFFAKRRRKMHEISETQFEQQVGPREALVSELGPVKTTYEEKPQTVARKPGRPKKEN